MAFIAASEQRSESVKFGLVFTNGKWLPNELPVYAVVARKKCEVYASHLLCMHCIRQQIHNVLNSSRTTARWRMGLTSDENNLKHINIKGGQLTNFCNVLCLKFNFFCGKISEYLRCIHIFTARCYASAVLAMGLCPCLSVTSRRSTKTAKRRITQTTPHDSTGTLVF